jgi:hypothetical protein
VVVAIVSVASKYYSYHLRATTAVNRNGECGEQWQRASHEAIIRLVADETLAASETNKLNARMPTLHKQNWRINNVPDYLCWISASLKKRKKCRCKSSSQLALSNERLGKRLCESASFLVIGAYVDYNQSINQ